jgi:hypothetical protein
MNIRFVTKTVHAYLDYPVALSLVATPFITAAGRIEPLGGLAISGNRNRRVCADASH